MNFSPLKEITQADISSYKLLLTKMHEELLQLESKLPEYLKKQDEQLVSEAHHRAQTTFKLLELNDLNESIYKLRADMIDGVNANGLVDKIVGYLQVSAQQILHELDTIK
ncbi:MAG: hypothetical protein AAGI38_06190 [Bacteroidota bacterium]